MIFEETSLVGVYTIQLEKHGDDRGFFARAFCQREFGEMQLCTEFVQVNNSSSADVGTLRGMHYQLPPHAETKVVRCIHGALWDCVMDLRADSPTFGKWFGAELSAENRKMMYVPKGCAHGFISLKKDTEAFYFVDEYYTPHAERGIRWNDSMFNVQWPIEPVVISDKDRSHPDFEETFAVRGQGSAL